MKSFALRLVVAILTFIIGVSLALFGRPRPNAPGVLGNPVSPRSQERSSANIAAWRVLLSLENQDLGELDEESKRELKKAIVALVGPRDDWPLIPRLVSRISNAEGQTSYALIEESPLLTIPGDSGIRVHLFSLEGKLLGSSAFQSGWRITLTGMKVKYLPELGREVLEVSSRPAIGGRDVARQYYALIGEEMLLVRLEDSDGRLIRNYYDTPHATIGPTLTGRPADEWERALESNDVAEVLATLTWLGGTHLNPRNPLLVYAHEEMSEARLADEVRALEGVKAALGKLAQSENEWVRSAARLAVDVEYRPE